MKIVLEGVTKRFGALKALEEVSLEVAPGQIVALLGPNGAGKTTLLRCLGGVVVPDEGGVFYDGQRFHRSRLDLRRRLFFLPDFSPLIPDLSPLRHLGMVLRLYGATSPGVEDRVVEILRELGLLALAELPVSILSRGQAYKAALAGLLAADPEVWLLDEPFASGMDPDGISAFRRRALEAAGRGRTVIYSTQILDVAEDFADRIGVIDRGRLRAFGTLGNLRERFGGGSLEEIFRRIREEGP